MLVQEDVDEPLLQRSQWKVRKFQRITTARPGRRLRPTTDTNHEVAKDRAPSPINLSLREFGAKRSKSKNKRSKKKKKKTTQLPQGVKLPNPFGAMRLARGSTAYGHLNKVFCIGR